MTTAGLFVLMAALLAIAVAAPRRSKGDSTIRGGLRAVKIGLLTGVLAVASYLTAMSAMYPTCTHSDCNDPVSTGAAVIMIAMLIVMVLFPIGLIGFAVGYTLTRIAETLSRQRFRPSGTTTATNAAEPQI